MGKKKVISLIVVILIVAGLFITFPVKVFSDNIDTSGITAISKSFNVNGLRNRLYIQMTITLTGAVNITIYSPKNVSVYTKGLGSTGETVNITAKAVISEQGTYKIVIALFGKLKAEIVITAYNQFMDPILKYVT
ncbi:MAG: hypothetical protein ACP6IP_03810 [Candidatus Njordarchaeia archaeon]